jgi:hypothetical protein
VKASRDKLGQQNPSDPAQLALKPGQLHQESGTGTRICWVLSRFVPFVPCRVWDAQTHRNTPLSLTSRIPEHQYHRLLKWTVSRFVHFI